MCGIVGFTGNQQAAPILLNGLSKLEYRGYDSAGLAVRDGESLAEVVKATGKLKNLADKIDNGKALPGTCGIGHTRWATHGEPSQNNAHPHVSGNALGSASGPVESDVVGVHNGIIENYEELKAKLMGNGYTFYSSTDTEVAIKLVDYYYKKYKIGPIDAINRMMVRVRGSYALALMFKDYPGEIYAARKDSPMVIGTADGESFLASDVPALLKYTRDIYYVDDLHSGFDLSLKIDVFIQGNVRPEVNQLNHRVLTTNTVNTTEPLDNADGVPVNVVVDQIVTVLQVLAFGNTVGSDQHINRSVVIGHQQMLVLGNRREAGQDGLQITMQILDRGLTIDSTRNHGCIQPISGFDVFADMLVQIVSGVCEGGENNDFLIAFVNGMFHLIL